ncbi:hypothetical protein TH63_16345 [Rufibacter radiotolerans]|uniref:Uncharacterized protein n=1 Tax=Rufibacter radiotolerans TaxID=1379910 RepID=A0A0H4VST5_9BACT|nr:hypothetical protein TH63_16345 [Rufibacter radiotolerans]
MIDGLLFICWGALCFYAAFFTKNNYAFMMFIPNDGLKFSDPNKGNKIRNIIGVLVFIPIGIILLG